MALKLVVAALLLSASTVVSAFSTYSYKSSNKIVTASLQETGNGIPECSRGSEQYSGFINVNATFHKNYFYWAFGPRTGRVDAPVVLWMTGGPGCSSTLAALIENGPCHINTTTGDLINNPYGWNNDAYLIYVDQPAGVGFSTSDAAGQDTNEEEVSEDMYWFLQEFFKSHPNFLANGNKLSVFGESYGGHFAPATAHKIFTYNELALVGNSRYTYLPLVGLAVGNGLTVPSIQYQYYPEFVYDWCIEKLGVPCVSQADVQQMNASVPSCVAAINSCVATKSDSNCQYASAVCNTALLGPYESTGLNVYDIRKPCVGQLCYNLEKVVSFMNKASTQKAFGVPQQLWTACSPTVNQAFTNDWWQRFDSYVADMLNGHKNGRDSVRVMIYAGDVDFICNWIGNKAWTLRIDWPMKATFAAAPDVPFTVGNSTTPVAKIRSISGITGPMQLTFAQVFNAGHMVPMDQPATMYDMLDRFINNKGWGKL